MSKPKKRWPPNVGVNNGRLRYRIKVPPDVETTYGKRLYVEYLDLDDSATYDQAFEAAKPAKARYEALIKSLRNSSPDAFTENELEALASDHLKRAKLERGELALHNIGPAFIKQYELEGVEESLGRKLSSDDLKLIFFPELTQPVDRAKDLQQALGVTKGGMFDGLIKHKPTIQELARFRAAEAATTVRSRQPKTLSWWWNDYLEFRGLTDPNERDTKRLQGYWNRFLLHIGDHVVTPDSQTLIDDALEDYVYLRLKEVKVSTVKRQLAEVLAALSRMARKQRPKWPEFRVPEMPDYEAEEKEPLSADDQIMLVQHCLAEKSGWVSAVHLLELQGGMMCEEVSTLKPEDLFLDNNYPYIVVRKGKTVARPRIVPIVLGLGVIKKLLPEAIKSLQVADPSATPRNHLVKLFDGKYKNHHLRHTIRVNATAHGVSHLQLETICGWSGNSINKHTLKYGSAGLADSSPVIKATFEASLQIHQHLMHLDTTEVNRANVVKLQR